MKSDEVWRSHYNDYNIIDIDNDKLTSSEEETKDVLEKKCTNGCKDDDHAI